MTEEKRTMPPTHFILTDAAKFLTQAGKSILEDEFGKCFQPQPRHKYKLFSIKWPVWICSIFIRYCILFPLRLFIFISSSFLAVVVIIPLALTSPKQSPIVELLMHWYLIIVLVGLGICVKSVGEKPRPKEPHIFVANHTSVTDYPIASCVGRAHAVVAQAHGGMFGWVSRYVLRPLTNSLLFDRNETRDRSTVSKRMREHIQDLQANPLLIFPEGTCVNNEYTVLFHKGSFEMDCLICPVAIKYDKSRGDPYFNTREQTFTVHLMYLMTRWGSSVKVHWLKPQRRHRHESSSEFSNRVKALISEAAGLRNLSWDGYLKNYRPNSEKQAKMRSATREGYEKELSEKLCCIEESHCKLPGDDVDGPAVPVRDYFPDWLSEESRTTIQNELLQHGDCIHKK